MMAANPQVNSSLRVYLLGRFEVEQGSRLIESEQWRSGKARSLFKIMLGRRNFQISRQEVAELLWPELDQDRAYNNLNQAVYSLRRTLEPDLLRAGTSAYLRTEGSRLQLNPGLIGWIDLEEFKRLHRQAQLSGELSLFEQAASLYGGDYLPEDLYEDWSVGRRESLRQEWAGLLAHMATLYQRQGQTEKYLECLHRVLENDFSHEESVQKLMQALGESGRREDALSLYRSFSSKLHNRLSMEPLPETRQLYQEIMAGKVSPRPVWTDPALTRPTPAGTVPPAPPVGPGRAGNIIPFSTLPAPFVATSAEPGTPLLVGREAQIESWQHSLRACGQGAGGLTLLRGEAGAGKTFLARALAAQAQANGFEVVESCCYPEQTDIPYGAISELLERALTRLERADLELCLQQCTPALGLLVPGLRMSRVAAGVETPQIYTAALQALGWLASRRPLVLLIDDLHYLSGSSARLLRYLLSQPSLRGVLVLGGLRPAATRRLPELERLVCWAEETGQAVHTLRRLNEPELARLATATLGQPPARNLLQTLLTLSQGNPRLAVELLKGGANDTRPVAGEGHREVTTGPDQEPLPPSLVNYLRRMVAELSGEAQVLLSLTGLMGPAFDFESVRQIILHRRDGAGWWIELDLPRLGQAFTELSGAGLIEEQWQEYRFTYPLLAECVVADLPYSQRECWREVIEWAHNQKGNGVPDRKVLQL